MLEKGGCMLVTIFFKDGMVKSSAGIDQIKESPKDFELYMFDWKDELFCCNKYRKQDIAQISIR